MKARSARLALGAAAISYAAVSTRNKQIPQAQDNLELCQVQVVFRHGARTPLHVPPYLPSVSYGEDLLEHSSKTCVPYQVISLNGDILSQSPFEKSYLKRGKLKGGCYPGQLTHVGADQMYELGLFLKKRYVEDMMYLSKSHQKRFLEISTRSTNIQRTILSARCVLAGIFAGENPDKEFVIYASEPNQEIMYPNYHSCGYLAALTRWAWDDPDKIPGMKKVREAIQSKLNIPKEEKLDLISLRDNLAAERAHTKKSMSLTELLQVDVEKAAMQVMDTTFVGIEAVRQSSLKLAIGPFIDLLLCNMEKHLDKSDAGLKMLLFSGHDTTLIPLLSAFGIDETRWPPYAASVIIELLCKRGDQPREEPAYYVRLLYNGEVKQVKNCSSSLCSLEEFKRALSGVRIAPKQYRQLCAKADGEELKALARAI